MCLWTVGSSPSRVVEMHRSAVGGGGGGGWWGEDLNSCYDVPLI